MVNFRKVKVWEKAHALTLEIYRETRRFPSEERYGLTSQLRRSSASIAANIAEECGRRGKADFARFLDIALGSASEVEYHILLALDLGYLSPENQSAFEAEVTEVKRMLTGFVGKLRSDI